MNGRLELPENADVAKQVLDDRHKERGVLGKIFGGRDHAPTNIAGAVIFGSLFSILTLVCVNAAYPNAKLDYVISGLFALLTSVIGYLFGRGSSEHK